jgi:hypothetical protein
MSARLVQRSCKPHAFMLLGSETVSRYLRQLLKKRAMVTVIPFREVC